MEAGVRRSRLRRSSHLGDVIVELDGALIKDSSDLYRTLDKLSVGQEIMMKVRGENKVDLPLTLDDLKDQPQMPPPGIYKIVPGRQLPPESCLRELPPGFPPGFLPAPEEDETSVPVSSKTRLPVTPAAAVFTDLVVTF